MVWLSWLSCYLMFGALLGLSYAVVYFVSFGYGDSGIEFEVEYEANPSFMFDRGLMLLIVPQVSR